METSSCDSLCSLSLQECNTKDISEDVEAGRFEAPQSTKSAQRPSSTKAKTKKCREKQK